MCKFFTFIGLSLALFGCGAGSEQEADSPLNQTQQNMSAPATNPVPAAPAANDATEHSQTPGAAVANHDDDDDDDNWRQCREHRCKRYCYRRGCYRGFCYGDDDYSRCVCRRCY